MHSLHGYEPKVGMTGDHPPRVISHTGNAYITVQPYTVDQYRRRIERAFKAVEFGRDNPFAAIIAERIESARAEFVAEVAEAKSVEACPF